MVQAAREPNSICCHRQAELTSENSCSILRTAKFESVCNLKATEGTGAQQPFRFLQFHLSDMLQQSQPLLLHESPPKGSQCDFKMICDVLTAANLLDVLTNPISHSLNTGRHAILLSSSLRLTERPAELVSEYSAIVESCNGVR